MSLPSSMADFVPCDRLLQKAYSLTFEVVYDIGQNRGFVPRGDLVDFDFVGALLSTATSPSSFSSLTE